MSAPGPGAPAVGQAPSCVASARLDGLAVAALAALVNGLLLASVPLEVRLLGALVLFVALPGYLFVRNVFSGTRPDAPEEWLLALGCGYVLAALLALGLHGLFRPLYVAHVLLGADALDGGLLLGVLARRAELRPQFVRPGWSPLLVVTVAAAFRLVDLGHSEFQGDEARVVLRTLAVLQGVPDALISHLKPSGEVLLEVMFVGGLDGITELEGRLPFALAGVAAVLAFYRLGRALFGARAGLAAGLLLAVNGYFVGFGRILQYQSVDLLLASLAILCLFRFARGSTVRLGYAVVGALLLAGSGLMALSAVFLLPVAAVALGPRLFGPVRASRRELAAWLWPLLPLLPGAAVVYLLLARGPGETLDPAIAWSYWGSRLGERRLYFNLEPFLLSASHYTSSLYLLVVLGAGVLVLIEPLYEQVQEIAARLAGRAGRAAAVAGLALDAREVAPAALSAGALALLLGSARRSLGWKLALVWMAGPLFTHLFLVRVPFTHWREVFPGLLLLVAAAAAGVYARLAHRPARVAALVGGGLFLAASGHYVYVAWIQPWPEYQSLYPMYRHPLDWTGLAAPRAGGTYGAAHRHGWKAVGELVAHGQLPAEYATNDSPAIPAWYLKRPRLCGEPAQLFVRAAITPRDYQAIERGEAPRGYALAGRVYVEDRPTLALLVRQPWAGEPGVYRAEDYARQFDRELASPRAPVGQLYRQSVNFSPGCASGT